MSASLVGSEMCIRDSCLALASGSWGSAEAAAAPPRQRRGWRHLPSDPIPCLLYTSDAADDM
eukprot:1332027-Alexandrium_andersonii.AAC.1